MQIWYLSYLTASAEYAALSQCGKGMKYPPEARLVRPQQQQSERECTPELHLHSKSPSDHKAARCRQLIVDKKEVVGNCILAGSPVERPKGIEEAASAQECQVLRRTTVQGQFSTGQCAAVASYRTSTKST